MLVIGGGLVGLSTAHALSRLAPGTRVVVLEQEPGPATGHHGGVVHSGVIHSGVIHSGIHHRPGSLAARYAVRGAAEMVRFCAEHGIPHEVTGKLIVATERAELPRLHALVQRGRRHGIPVRELGPAQIREYEPEVRALAAIRVATSGVVDRARVAEQLARSSGAEIRYGARAERIGRRRGPGPVPGGRVSVRTASGEVLRGKVLVNCAGARADRVARLAGDEPGVRLVPVTGGVPVRGDGGGHGPVRPSPGRGLVQVVPDPGRPFPGVRAVLPDGTPVDDVLVREADGVVHVLDGGVPGVAGVLPLGGAVGRRVVRMLRG
ncbi:FAD-dependent oxidoreductase [Streptomyces sp. NBC_00536]|nr:FAD-dependent oxidoreductase [Streptomyces sp. NBC_00536]WUC83795.1 FAD-dependent oxidoreductase [Streptomyces sp. NBC_00536]